MRMIIAQSHQEWLDLRRAHFGGSDVAPLLLDKEDRPAWMKTPLQLYLEKTGQVGEAPDNPVLRRGRAMEEPTAQRYAEVKGFQVSKCPTLIDGNFAANIDRIVSMPDAPAVSQDKTQIICKRILECKTSQKAWGNESPVYYYGQVQWYMGFLPYAESADIACWFGDRVMNEKEGESEPDFAIYNIPRSQEFIDFAREKADEFMEKYVNAHVMPEPECESDARIKWAVSHDNAPVVIATDASVQAIDRIKEIDKKLEELDRTRDEEVLKLMKTMGEATILMSKDGRVLATWKSQKPRTTIDWKGLTLKYYQPEPKWVEEFTTVSKKPVRPFRVLADD